MSTDIRTKEGEFFTATIEHVYQDRLDGALVEQALGAVKFKACKKTIDFDMTKTKRKVGKKRDFVNPNLANATASGLVDLLGQVREEMSDLKKLEGIYKTALDARIALEKLEDAK